MNLLTQSQLSVKLGISERTLRQWIRDGILPPPMRIKNRTYWNESEIDAAILSMQQTTTPNEGNNELLNTK